MTRRELVPNKHLVTSADNALDSLERLAAELEEGGSGRPLGLKGILAWGWHAVALLSYMRMQPQRDRFDAWIWDYLAEGSPELDFERDAHWEERQRLSLLEILDVFSEVEMPLLKPEFYQGWTDRTVRCQTLRRQIVEIIGSGIGSEQRDELLKLLAAYHRLLRFPAAVEIDVDRVMAGLPDLLDFIEVLIDVSGPRGNECLETLGRCKEAIG
jgi:hypothetical protein